MRTEQDAARVAALESYGVLDGEPRGGLTAIADLAARIAGVPMATVDLFTADVLHRVAAVGLEAGVSAREDAVCDVVLREGTAVLVEDATRDERFAGGPFVEGVPGEVRFFAAHPLVTPEGVVIGTLCVFDVVPRPVDPELEYALSLLAGRVIDVLQLELLTRRLAAVGSAPSAADERLGAFAGQISHDLKNPLAAISMSLEMVRDEVADGDPTVDALLARASRGAERMDLMIGDLLAFARGGAAPDLRPVDLSELTQSVLVDLQEAVDGGSVAVESLPTVQGDPAQLRLVLQNLIANALKFTSRAGTIPRVVVSTRQVGQSWRIEVADNGPGVPAESRERVFEPFIRLDKSIPGTGVGLSTSKRIVEAHRGRIGIEDAAEGGALVWFELPEA